MRDGSRTRGLRPVRCRAMSENSEMTAVIDSTDVDLVTVSSSADDQEGLQGVDLASAIADIDRALGQLAHRDLVSTGEMTDLLLDLRAILTDA